MTQNQNEWLKSWLKPANLIALGALIVATVGGVTIFSNRQEVDVQNNCDVSDVAQKSGNKPSSSQSIKFSDDSTLKNITQE